MSRIGHEPSHPGPDEAALLALEDAVLGAIRDHDADALLALLTEDFVLRGPDGSATSRDAFVAGATSVPGTLLELSVEHLRATVVHGVGVLTGIQRARVRLADGTEVLDVQAFTDVCVREPGPGGRWRMALAHSAPPGASA